jgi:hypothetical protein
MVEKLIIQTNAFNGKIEGGYVSLFQCRKFLKRVSEMMTVAEVGAHIVEHPDMPICVLAC